MKKISLSNIKDTLTKYELNKIMAGSGDVNNKNSTFGCTCTYNNNSVINNNNTVTACECLCNWIYDFMNIKSSSIVYKDYQWVIFNAKIF